MPVPIQQSAAVIDFGPRYFYTETVAASPAAATETIIASLTIAADLSFSKGARLTGFAAYTVGASGVSGNLRIRKTDVNGTVVKATGALTVTAANLVAVSILGVDETPSLPNQVYVLTLEVGSGAAASTVSAATLDALVV